MLCAVAGCDSDARSKGYCWLHFGRFRRNGDPTASGQHGGHNRGIARPATENVPDPEPLRAVRLELATRREAGVPFARAWREVMAAAPAEWAEALRQTRYAWRAAYARSGAVIFRLDVASIPGPSSDMRRSAPPLTLSGARHDGPSSLEVVVPPWCS